MCLGLQPGPAGHLHLGAESQQHTGLHRLDAPEVERVTDAHVAGMATSSPHPHTADDPVHRAPQLPGPVECQPSSFPTERREGAIHRLGRPTARSTNRRDIRDRRGAGRRRPWRPVQTRARQQGRVHGSRGRCPCCGRDSRRRPHPPTHHGVRPRRARRRGPHRPQPSRSVPRGGRGRGQGTERRCASRRGTSRPPTYPVAPVTRTLIR